MTTDDSQPNPGAAEPGSTEAELIAVRRQKLAKLRELGVDPFGGRFATDTTPGDLQEGAEPPARALPPRVSSRAPGSRQTTAH